MITLNGRPVTVQATGTTQNGRPVVIVDGDLCTVEELEA